MAGVEWRTAFAQRLLSRTPAVWSAAVDRAGCRALLRFRALQRADRTDLGVDAVLNCGIVVASPRRPRLYGRRDPCPCADETADRRRARRSAAALVGAATPMAGFRWVSWL